MRVLVDTNILISGLLSPSAPPFHVLRAGLESRYDLMVSQETRDELIEKCQTKPSLVPRISPSMLENILAALRSATILPAITTPIDRYIKDEDDDQLIAHALAEQVDILVSGDRLLLNEKGE